LTDRKTRADWDDDMWRLPRRRIRLDAQFVFLALTLMGLAGMGLAYISTLKPVQLLINQQSQTIFTNQYRVAGVLDDAAIPLHPEDIVFPAPVAPVPDNQPISIKFARPLEILVDGETIEHRTQSVTVGDALREAGIILKSNDHISVEGTPVQDVTRFAQGSTGAQISVRRAVPIHVDDNGAVSTIYTTAPTLGEALRQAGLVLYLGDYVSPDLGLPIAPDWQVYIRRSRAATINVDGKTFRTRTLGNTIANMLADEGIELISKDYSIPPATELVRDGMSVQVMRVREEFVTEAEPIAFETVWQADPALDVDARQVVHVGVEGIKKRTIRITYENGREVRRALDKEWIDAAPITNLISYGTKIVRRDLLLPNGQTMAYWRKIRMLATSYTAASSGKARTHPEFGITFLGLQAGSGIAAIDPRVVNLRSTVYVPGYGMAYAGDTGGRIKGRRIDLGYDEANLVLWYTWLDVYVLWPPPPSDQIHWVIPDTPRERTTATR
jgi:resuscitation-promoting factor RpfB